MSLKECIRHMKFICEQGVLRHKNVILDETFQKELLEIIKCYEQLEQKNKELQQKNEKLQHYKTLYQSLKKQKEELRSWLKTDKDKIKVFDTKDNKTVELGIVLGLGMCLEKLEELEGVSNE